MTASISYINLSWAVLGIIDKDVQNSLQSMKRPDEPIEATIERYVIGYLFFGILLLLIKKMNKCGDETVVELGRKKMEEYITSHPPIATLPKFYIAFLNQLQIGCDAQASVMFSACSFSKSFFLWNLTVFESIYGFSPISELDTPLTESCRISFSRSDRIISHCFRQRLPSNE